MAIFENLNLNSNDNIKVYAFVGPSGTGKSYRAQMVASENNINYIIDDGLLVSGNNVIAGVSAKKATTKVETVRKAVFINEEDRAEMRKAIRKYKPDSILILGTSDGMVSKIATNLGIPQPSKTIYINEVATETEMETAKRIRTTQGKHVIPVPTFEIKKDFSGYILDPLQIFKLKGKGNDPYISEKSIIRPTFSYLGNFTISDTVFRQIAEYLAKRSDAIYKVMRIRVQSTPEGPDIYMEVSINFGYNIIEVLREFKMKIKKEIERLTTMTVRQVTIVAKGIHVPENLNEIKQVEEKREQLEKSIVEKWKNESKNANVINGENKNENVTNDANKEKTNTNETFVVAIDGPAGTGKGTITKLIAEEMGFVNIDTGAMYRSIALKGLREGVELENCKNEIQEKDANNGERENDGEDTNNVEDANDRENINNKGKNTIERKCVFSNENVEKLIEISKSIKLEIKEKDGVQTFWIDGEDVSNEIRSKEVTDIVSQVSSIPEVRENMVNLQRKMAEGKKVIMEGRDITTVVFPNANVKIYLDAKVEERAKRRYEENVAKGMRITYEETLEAVKTRDYNDINKPIGALKIAKDAIVIDTTEMTIEEVKEKVKEIIFSTPNKF